MARLPVSFEINLDCDMTRDRVDIPGRRDRGRDKGASPVTCLPATSILPGLEMMGDIFP